MTKHTHVWWKPISPSGPEAAFICGQRMEQAKASKVIQRLTRSSDDCRRKALGKRRTELRSAASPTLWFSTHRCEGGLRLLPSLRRSDFQQPSAWLLAAIPGPLLGESDAMEGVSRATHGHVFRFSCFILQKCPQEVPILNFLKLCLVSLRSLFTYLITAYTVSFLFILIVFFLLLKGHEVTG